MTTPKSPGLAEMRKSWEKNFSKSLILLVKKTKKTHKIQQIQKRPLWMLTEQAQSMACGIFKSVDFLLPS